MTTKYGRLAELRGYHYRLVRFESHDLGRTVVRAYKPDDDSTCIDITFSGTVFVRIPTTWSDEPFKVGSDNECKHVLDELGKQHSSVDKIYQIGDTDFGIIATGCMLKTPKDLDANWNRQIEAHSNPAVLEEALSRFADTVYYYVGAYNYISSFLALVPSGIEGYDLGCANVRFLQIPIGSQYGPLQIASPEEKRAILRNVNLQEDGSLTLLRGQAHQMPVYVLCKSVYLAPVR